MNSSTADQVAASVRGLEKTFATKGRVVSALRGINLEIATGEYVVVLGPSGCGKTTLIRCLAGLERPTAGRLALEDRVVFNGSDGTDVAPNNRNVGLVFQNYALWPHMNVEKNVAYPLRMRKVPSAERTARIQEVLSVLECAQLAKRLPAELSGGQQQRVALARALVSEPGILLLDEPLSNLDALLRISLRSELLRLHRKIGFTAIHITHDQEEALEMGDRVVLMREGAIEQMGHPKDVYAQPVSPYAANFLGVRNKTGVTVGNGRLNHPGGPIHGSADLAAAWPEGEQLQLFARDQDVRLSPANELPDRPGEFTLTGTLAQIVLGPGGRPRYIVDVVGKQWYASQASEDLRPGDQVLVSVSATRALLYHGDTLIER